MGLTNYPNGVASFGFPQLGSGPFFSTGNVFFAHSGTGSNGTGRGLSPETPFSTIDWAVGQTTANKGDVIFVMPGHVETITSAAGLNLDVAGITIIGLGNGPNRPRLVFEGAVTADMDVGAAGIKLINVVLEGNLDNITAMVDVNAADFQMIGCEYKDITGQVAIFLIADAAADRLLIDGLTYRGAAAAGTTQAIQLVGCEQVTIQRCEIDGNFSVAAINCATTAVPNLTVRDCRMRTRNAADVLILDTITGSTGVLGPNLWLTLQDDAINITEAITGATFRLQMPVEVVNADNQKSIPINWVASADA